MQLSTFILHSLLLVLFVETLGKAQEELPIRLRGGPTPFEGRLEVLVDNTWGTIEHRNWDIQDAIVICKQLGFSTAEEAVLGGVYSPADPGTPVHLTNIQCTMDAGSLADCAYQSVTTHLYSTHSRDAGVKCALEQFFRLSNTTVDYIGRLDIYVQSTNLWERVCYSTSWNGNYSVAVCKQLGYDQLLNISAEGESNMAQTIQCSGDPLSCSNPTLLQETCSSGYGIRLGCAGSPHPPHSLVTALPSCTSITLTWEAPNHRGSTIEGYTVRYRPVPHPTPFTTQQIVWSTMSLGASGNSGEFITINGLLSLTEYEFQVSATNSIGTSSFSDSNTVVTPPPEIGSPILVQVDSHGQTTAEISWMEPLTCGIDNLTYEISYTIEADGFSSVSFQDSVTPSQNSTDSTIHHMLQGLLPYTQYAVKVRVVGYVDGGNGSYRVGNGTLGLMGKNAILASNFSDVTLFTTKRSVPSGSPQAFVAFFSLLQSTAHFQWEPVSPHLTNGIIVGYSLSCVYFKDGLWHWITEIVNNNTFTFSLMNLQAAAQYECSVAAKNDVGQGPDSAPILFTTPADLNQRPSAPQNVAFAIIEPNSNKESFFVEATWIKFECESNFSCVELLGYVILCRAENTGDEVRKTLWLSDYANNEEVYDDARIPVNPFTRYDCSMSSLNTYGVGQPGSRISVVTPETSPTEAPTQIYSTNMESESVRLHWTYNEYPKAGVLTGFAIYLYEQDPRFPEREGTFVVREILTEIPDQSETGFTYLLMYLSAGTTYNVFVAAFTNVGEGPQGRLAVTTLRTVPSIVPESVFPSITSSSEPFPITIEWRLISSLTQPNHIGFIVHCYENSTGTPNVLLTHPVLTTDLVLSYSTQVLLPATCAQTSVTYECVVAAFNERGEGQRSKPAQFNLPCSGSGGGGLFNSFLADPLYGITFLALTILLAIVLVVTLIFCCVCIARYDQRSKREEHYSTVPYDEGYISMAPSGSNSSAMKTPWSRNNSCPTAFSTGVNRLSLEQDDYGHYDEIPGERVSKTENVYDEIPLRLTPLPHGRSNNSSMRSSPAMQIAVINPSIHSVSSTHSFDLDESQVTTMTNVTKTESQSAGAGKLSALSSEESLVKAKGAPASDEPKPSPFKDHTPDSTRKREGGYVEVVTTKDGKRCVRELGNSVPLRSPAHSQRTGHSSPPQQSTPRLPAHRASLKEETHSYQNVAEIKRPKSASSARSYSVTEDSTSARAVNRNSFSGRSNRHQVISADFQLSTVTDSDV